MANEKQCIYRLDLLNSHLKYCIFNKFITAGNLKTLEYLIAESIFAQLTLIFYV